jgi:hypothetical protein
VGEHRLERRELHARSPGEGGVQHLLEEANLVGPHLPDGDRLGRRGDQRRHYSQHAEAAGPRGRGRVVVLRDQCPKPIGELGGPLLTEAAGVIHDRCRVVGSGRHECPIELLGESSQRAVAIEGDVAAEPHPGRGALEQALRVPSRGAGPNLVDEARLGKTPNVVVEPIRGPLELAREIGDRAREPQRLEHPVPQGVEQGFGRSRIQNELISHGCNSVQVF